MDAGREREGRREGRQRRKAGGSVRGENDRNGRADGRKGGRETEEGGARDDVGWVGSLRELHSHLGQL